MKMGNKFTKISEKMEEKYNKDYNTRGLSRRLIHMLKNGLQKYKDNLVQKLPNLKRNFLPYRIIARVC